MEPVCRAASILCALVLAAGLLLKVCRVKGGGLKETPRSPLKRMRLGASRNCRLPAA